MHPVVVITYWSSTICLEHDSRQGNSAHSAMQTNFHMMALRSHEWYVYIRL